MVRKSLTISGSGYDQYLYSPRPNPCLAMTMVLRKVSSRSYVEARDRHSPGVSTDFTMVAPYLSKSAVIPFQSKAATRFGIEGVFVVMDKNVSLPSKAITPVLAFKSAHLAGRKIETRTSGRI